MESLVSDIPAGDGKNYNLFTVYIVRHFFLMKTARRKLKIKILDFISYILYRDYYFILQKAQRHRTKQK